MMALFGLPNPNARQLILVISLLTLAGAIVAFRRPVFDKISIWTQAALFVVGEACIYAFYINFRQPFHWANHLFPALVMGAIIYGIFLAVKKRPMRGEIIVLLPLHLFAMAPDPMFSLNWRPHETWMNMFSGHIWVHFLPGRLTGWFLTATVATGLYIWALVRWLGKDATPTARPLETGGEA